MKGEQLPLSVQLRVPASFDNYYAGPNRLAVEAVRQLLDADGGGGVLLFGPHAAGKTHLLQAAHRAFGALGLPSRMLSLSQNEGALTGDTIGALQNAPLLCIDDIEALATHRGGAMLLLRLIDGLRARGGRLLVSARHPPERLDCALHDLRTRLSAYAVMGLRPLDDGERMALLRGHAAQRGFELPDDAARWMLNHLPRDTGSLLEALEQLDRASLSAKRRLSLPFVQQVLKPVPGP